MAEGTSLLRKHTGLNLYRGFESHRLRQDAKRKPSKDGFFFRLFHRRKRRKRCPVSSSGIRVPGRAETGIQRSGRLARRSAAPCERERHHDVARTEDQAKILNAKPRDKAYKLANGGGLYLEVTPAGGKHFTSRRTLR